MKVLYPVLNKAGSKSSIEDHHISLVSYINTLKYEIFRLILLAFHSSIQDLPVTLRKTSLLTF